MEMPDNFLDREETCPSKGSYPQSAKLQLTRSTWGKIILLPNLCSHKKKVANYLQSTASNGGYLVAETVRMGKQQVIALPLPINQAVVDIKDQKITRKEAVHAITKQRASIDSALKKGYTTVWDQCSQQVCNKLKVSKDWEHVQREQLLHKLITKIERICVGFNDHKQEIFNLVCTLKMLFLYTQMDKETVGEY
jgi:hypothetical protein